MTHTTHDLAADFPGQAARIHDLKAADAHFARLVADYEAANRAVHRAETRLDTVSEDHETALRRQRAALKDAIARALRQG